MDKLKMHTPDLAEENYKKLAALFPDAVTETITGYDENGKAIIERAIDKDVLMQEINAQVVDDGQERYQFTWPDKRKSIILANQPIAKTLRFEKDKSVGKDGISGGTDSENIYIEGENLDALKLLHETYLGQVKFIYIDPPYNTGKDFVYGDNYVQNTTDYRDNSGQIDENGNQLVQNSEGNGRFHTNWLNMIYPRIKIAKDLLTNDGVIFISIDDNEQENLEKVCNEIFGEQNFVGCIILQTATDNNPRQIATEHEYILCYAKNLNAQSAWSATSEKAQLIVEKYSELKKKYGSDIQTIQTELRTWIKKSGDTLKGVAHYDNVDDKGVFHDGDIANTTFGGYKYEVIHPVTHKPCKIPEKGFRFPESTMRKMIANDDIMFGPDETTLIKPKKRLENAKDVLRSVIYEDGRTSTKQFESLMARDIFQNPKSPMVLGRLMNFIVNSGDIVLDFFSGSGTTAEAVLRNNAKDRKNIHYIMVQLPENLDESIKFADSKAKKTINNAIRFLDGIGLKHTICDIGEERIRRAGKKIKEETGADIDYGFRCFKIDSSNMKEVYYRPADIGQMNLDQYTDNIKEDRTPEDLLIQVMLDLGILLSSKIERTEIAGKKVFSVADGYLIACFDSDVNEDVVKAIAKQHPYYAVFRDNSMANDSVAANFEQIFTSYSPETVRKVL